MLYHDLRLPRQTNRPFFYSNFVETVDGKVAVPHHHDEYWPIGGQADRATFLELRAHADVIIHGKKTAMSHKTIDSTAKAEFKKRRVELNKSADVTYVVICNNPDQALFDQIANPSNPSILAVSTDPKGSPTEAEFPDSIPDGIEVWHVNTGENVDLHALADLLHEKHFAHALVEGGPTVFAAFLQAELIDEMFVTISPKIIGNQDNSTITMVEGHLFTPDRLPKLSVVSLDHQDDEVFLRYAMHYPEAL